jgi:DNA-binding NarL/FixJ family response regulator
MGTTRVLLADHHRSFVEALAIRLAAEPALDVVGVAVRPDEVVAAVVRDQAVDVAVLAVDDGDSAFLELAPELKRGRPAFGLVAVSAADDPALLLRAVKHGFRGWITKDAGIQELLDVVTGVSRGETRIPPRLVTQLLGRLLDEDEEHRDAQLRCSTLTHREREVLAALSRGATRTEIAE